MPGPTHLIHPTPQRRKQPGFLLWAWMVFWAIGSVCWLLAKIFPHGRIAAVCYMLQGYTWIVFVIGAPVYFVWRLVQTVMEVRADECRVSRVAKGLCAECGYDLKGNTSGVCPECGRQLQQTSV